ncbi:MAG TPA: type III-B CRISPR-associated protein Cas10/Cmr2 [Cyanobacteria bacterium UBA8803]|nr:type III-B CRISPR-associated protein Cas10/Cmr2 [Cyanobacteria bacterium UBA9273]HBL61709.1 type III-B CRISPR-associated protein Cas10/Cmr2 [Cyanobacteria bacterium UBA8803]
MNSYYRKLYVLMKDLENLEQFEWWQGHLQDLQMWWGNHGKQFLAIASSSDRINIKPQMSNSHNSVEIHHPISGQSQFINPLKGLTDRDIEEIKTVCAQITQAENPDNAAKKIFWWLWRFYPELSAQRQPDCSEACANGHPDRFYPELSAQRQRQSEALLFPAHKILPDCPLHSYYSTVSALVGAIPEDRQTGQADQHPYLFLFTFSPVQEFIKASRKFLDFWSGSYLLHYLGAKICWHIAELYGPDAIITPSLWSQEIIDALMVKEFDRPDQNYTVFANSFKKYTSAKSDPVSRFTSGQSTSLSTAGFPNVITALVPGQTAAKELGQALAAKLTEEWSAIAHQVREHIKQRVRTWLANPEHQEKRGAILKEFPEFDRNACQEDWRKWLEGGCWEWNKLWDAQINNTWESYWTAVPLGHPDQELLINKDKDSFQEAWKEAQNAIAPSRGEQTIPTAAEELAYDTLNVGTWWGNVQARLGQLIQAVKNTRTWQIPVAPGERSTLSGQFSAVHPQLHYEGHLRTGAGVSAGSMRLFWRVMAEAYPGLFNGSEKLNALELTKRMAWVYGGVADSLGIPLTIDLTKKQANSQNTAPKSDETEDDYQLAETDEIDYEQLIRFPNLSSIAAARFAHNNPQKVRQYWRVLRNLIHSNLPDCEDNFSKRTRGRPFQVPKTDTQINPSNRKGQNFNGVMFSSKWLADDMGLNQIPTENQQPKPIETLRGLVEKAHQDSGFGDGSPADWWVIVLADGDGMGKYVSGAKLKEYKDYIVLDQIEAESRQVPGFDDLINKTKKRMGPATHVGLNRALLDFSNRLVPYITEKRFCGKVVYSGGDDVMAVLPLEDLPEFLRSLRAAWCGGTDPNNQFQSQGGYWHPKQPMAEGEQPMAGLPNRPLFTMGEGATMSMGIVIAYKSVPLPTVLENLWSAEKERAKKLAGTCPSATNPAIPAKDGLCFRVIYGGGNTLEALMKGHLLESWWQFIQEYQQTDLSPLLYRLAEELPRRACLTEYDRLFSKAAEVILNRREQTLSQDSQNALYHWLNEWEHWAFYAQEAAGKTTLGTQPQDLAMLLRFSAFWVDKMIQRSQWVE